MLVALVAHDKPGALQIRKDTRAAHLDYLQSTGVVEQAGPLLDAAGEMIGSLIVLDVADLAAARAWADADPYAAAGLFDSVTLTEWKRVIGG
ncbi:YciI family protein [Cognatishimia sp. F0-27]|uniref:YciI family protein n=1 Tax=Cognatishimia sp. F0-27 TaxID=2816855 RepID=UPI001D0C434D|nr:YciI family protein [Cognatishimia sp. F0-27]MCC1491205.1 YciI family protein [Cognatishimia sp. F0-27]